MKIFFESLIYQTTRYLEVQKKVLEIQRKAVGGQKQIGYEKHEKARNEK
jgi:hypothetical protein